MYQEYLNAIQTSISSLSSDQLKELLNDDEKLDTKVEETLSSLESNKDYLLSQNRSKAEENLNKEPQLIEYRGKIADLLEEGKTLCLSVQQKISEIKTKSGNVNQDTALALLQTAAAESEEESEKLVKSFTDNEINVENFLEQFLAIRKEMHLRKIKSEKMQELIRQNSNSRNTPFGSNHNYPSSGFYPMNSNFAPSGLPYPVGPAMPMPPQHQGPY